MTPLSIALAQPVGIVSVMGPHAQEDSDAIFARKTADVARVGVTFWLIPETKNVTLEHIERNLMAGEKLRNIGNR